MSKKPLCGRGFSFNPTPRFQFTIKKKSDMKFSTIAAIVLHITLAGVLVASAKNNLPEDTLLTKADYPKQSCFVQIWGDRAEIAVEGTRYELQCSPYRNELGEWEALESPTGDFIKVAENGVTEARIVGQYRVFLPE